MIDSRFQARIEAYYRAFNARAESAYLACFRPDGAVGGTLTGPPVAGVGVQKAILRTASGGLGDLMMVPRVMYQAQSEVVVAWDGEVRAASGGRTPVHGVTLFELDEEAKIRLAQVFWNPSPLTGQETAQGSRVGSDAWRAIEAYFQAFNAGDWSTATRLFDAEGRFGGTLAGMDLRGEVSFRSVFESVMVRFPGICMRPLEGFQAQDSVAVPWEGEAQGQDGRLHSIQGVSLFQFAPGGKFSRFRAYWDPRPLLQEA